MAIGYGIAKKYVNGKVLYYAHTKNDGMIGVNELCEQISQHCSLSMPLLHAAVMAFSDAMGGQLAAGKIVDMGSIGRFRVSFGSEGVECADDLCASKHIHQAKILYFPGKELRRGLKELEYRKV